MQDRPWNRDTDYDTLVKWWKDWEFGVVPKECLPPDGIVVEVNGVPICAGGLYIGIGTQFAFMEWIVTDKNADSRTTHKCLKKCIDSILQLAKGKGRLPLKNKHFTRDTQNTTIWCLRRVM